MTRPRILIGPLLATALVSATAFVSDAQISPDAIGQAIPATVMLYTPLADGKRAATCSGSFITSAGVILTAAHCVRATEDVPSLGIKKGQLLDPNGLTYVLVNLPNRIKPVPALRAQAIVDDPELDVALVRPVALLGQDKAVPLPPDFREPVLKMGDSDSLRIGDPIGVLGFPGIGGDSITVTQGHVTGFFADNANNKAWLKHDASTGHGASGGPIINARGEQIAVTSAGISEEGTATYRSALTNRIPTAWARYLQPTQAGGPPAGGTPGPGTPPQTGPAGPPAPPAPPTAPTGPAAPPTPPTAPPAPTRPATPPAPPAPAPLPNPPSPPAPPVSTGAVLRGVIVDGATGAGIPGAFVVFLRPGVNPQAAQRTDIIAGAQTDPNGAFQTAPPVPKGAAYPVVMGAKGYYFIAGTLEIPPTAADVIAVPQAFQLQRQ